MFKRPRAYTVAAITRMIKNTLEERFEDIWVEGEISGYLHHTSGHRYFTLKDDRAVLSAVIWRSLGDSLRFEPENGQKVLAFGSIAVYEKGGKYQLNCRKLQPVGVGELELAFRQLYEKLSAEGLFDEERKKPLPKFPQRIGIVTSPTGAAIRDIIKITRRRNNSVQLILYPAQVQGEGASETIAAGIRYFNSRDDIDLIITGRGGGSLEDLWAFNTETTVRAVAGSSLPIVSAVGHEVDTTLSDLAADLRVATPSAASERTIWSKRDFQETVASHLYAQANSLRGLVEQARQDLDSVLGRPVFLRPYSMVDQYRQYLDGLTRLLAAAGKNHFDRLKNRLSLGLSRLETLSPLAILERGYSVTRLALTGEVVTSSTEVEVGQKIETILAAGRLTATVDEKNKGD